MSDTSPALVQTYKNEFPYGTPLVCACEKGNLEDVKTFVNAGMDVNELGKSSYGTRWTPLMEAVVYEHSTIVEILLQHGANPATTDNDGDNALHGAAYHNKTTTTIVQLLLNHMTLEDINHKDINGDTPLDYCYNLNHSSIKQQLIDLMRSKGAKRASELSGSSSGSGSSTGEVVHEGTKTVDEQLAEQLKEAQEKGDVIDLVDDDDDDDINEQINRLIKQRDDINNKLKRLRRKLKKSNGSSNKRQRRKLVDAISELKF